VIEGQIQIAADVATAFAFISDPLRLAGCIPGCSDIRDLGAGRYSATLSNKVGFLSIKLPVVVELTKVEPPSAVDATITGNAPAGARLSANTRVRLEPAAGGTMVHYSVELGPAGALGGLFRAKNDELARTFGTNLKDAIDGGARV